MIDVTKKYIILRLCQVHLTNLPILYISHSNVSFLTNIFKFPVYIICNSFKYTKKHSKNDLTE